MVSRRRAEPERSFFRATWLRSAALVLVLAAPGLRSAPIPPPFHALYDPLNVVVSARLLAVEADGRLLLERIEVLHGDEVPERIEIAAPMHVQTAAVPGRDYLVGYTPYRRDSSRVRTIIVAPDGPRLLVSPGLEPALYPDEPDYRRLILYGRGGRIDHREDAVAVMLAALTDARAPMRELAAAQLALDPALSVRLSQSELKSVRATLTDPATPWIARAWLYDWAGREPERFDPSWLRRASARLLALAPLHESDGDGTAGQLVNAIFVQADLRAWRLPEPALVRWLDSDSTALAELALLQLRRQSPSREARVLDQALARTDLEPQMRHFLEGHQRRLSRRPPSSR